MQVARSWWKPRRKGTATAQVRFFSGRRGRELAIANRRVGIDRKLEVRCDGDDGLEGFRNFRNVLEEPSGKRMK